MVIVMEKLIHGVGINDADYIVQPEINGNRVRCPFYVRWSNMLKRCYNHSHIKKHPSYADCTVCDEWLKFSNFKSWMETQDWNGKQLDKDLLVEGNKIYSQDTCAFVDALTNTFTIDRSASRGEWPIGVSFDKNKGSFKVRCSNPFTKMNENIGRFSCPDAGHLAWKKRKHELACQLAELQSDERVAKALKNKYK